MSNNIKVIQELDNIKITSEQESFLGNGCYGGHEAFRAMSRGWKTALVQNYSAQSFKEFSIKDIDEAIEHLKEQKEKILNLPLDS